MIKVKCVDDSNSLHLVKGKTYIVDKTWCNSYIIDGQYWHQWRFEIVKDGEQMNHRQKMKELLPIIQAYCDGAEVEKKALLVDDWYACQEPLFNANHQYRIKQTPDTIDWSHVHKDYKWMVRDEDGEALLYTIKPKLGKKVWCAYDRLRVRALSYSSYKQGTVSWENSLVERPEGV